MNNSRLTQSVVACCLATVALASASSAWAQPVYPVKVGPTGRYLVDQTNAPYLIHGDTAWSIIVQLTREEAERYLEDRRQRGVNSIIAELEIHHYTNNTPYWRNRYGAVPFGSSSGLAQDFTLRNEAYFAHADWVINKAAEKGIQVFLNPLYLGYQGTDEGWDDEVIANGTARMRNYGLYLGNRYRNFPNIVWIMGGDRNPKPTGYPDLRSHIDALANGIREVDPNHLMTYHNESGFSSRDTVDGAPWLTLNATYTYPWNDHLTKKLIQDYNRTPVMPFNLLETVYENMHNRPRLYIRAQAYWADFSGGTGQFLGNDPIWHFGTLGYGGGDWTGSSGLSSPASGDMVHLRKLMLSRPWHLFSPDHQHRIVTAGFGTVNTDDYMMVVGASDRSTAMGYMYNARTITVDLSQISGSLVDAWWFNPATGSAVKIGQYSTTGSRQFTPPSSGGEGDWVIVLDDTSKGFPQPGGGAAASPPAAPSGVRIVP
jgi:hypothetical protein